MERESLSEHPEHAKGFHVRLIPLDEAMELMEAEDQQGGE